MRDIRIFRSWRMWGRGRSYSLSDTGATKRNQEMDMMDIRGPDGRDINSRRTVSLFEQRI